MAALDHPRAGPAARAQPEPGLFRAARARAEAALAIARARADDGARSGRRRPAAGLGAARRLGVPQPRTRGGDAVRRRLHRAAPRGIVLRPRVDGAGADSRQRRGPPGLRRLLHTLPARGRALDPQRGGRLCRRRHRHLGEGGRMLDRPRQRRTADFPTGSAPPARLCSPVWGGLRPGDPAAAVPQLPGERERQRSRLRRVLGGMLPASDHRHALHAGVGGPATRDRRARRQRRQRRRAAALSRSSGAALLRVRPDDGAPGDRRPYVDRLPLHRPLPRRGTHLPGRHPLHPHRGAAARWRHARWSGPG